MSLLCAIIHMKGGETMNIPSFEQFQSNMGEDYFKRLVENNADIIDGTYRFDSAQGINDAIDRLLSASYRLSLDMIADYHSWLASQLSD